MSKSERIFRIIAVAGLVVGTAALIRREAEIKILNDTWRLIRQHIDDQVFAEIIENYNEDGES